MSQEDFGDKIGLTKTAISYIESGKRGVTESNIKLICTTYNIREDWLKNGNGEMFMESDTFSLDKFVKERGMSQLELDIVKCYFELDPEIRKAVLKHLKDIFDKHSETAVSREDDINKKLEDYRLELEAEQKEKTSSASHRPKENLK